MKELVEVMSSPAYKFLINGDLHCRYSEVLGQKYTKNCNRLRSPVTAKLLSDIVSQAEELVPISTALLGRNDVFNNFPFIKVFESMQAYYKLTNTTTGLQGFQNIFLMVHSLKLHSLLGIILYLLCTSIILSCVQELLCFYGFTVKKFTLEKVGEGYIILAVLASFLAEWHNIDLCYDFITCESAIGPRNQI